mgnify:CR=1 FL=1
MVTLAFVFGSLVTAPLGAPAQLAHGLRQHGVGARVARSHQRLPAGQVHAHGFLGAVQPHALVQRLQHALHERVRQSFDPAGIFNPGALAGMD